MENISDALPPIYMDYERPIIIDGNETGYTALRDGSIISYKMYNIKHPVKLTPLEVGDGYKAVHIHIGSEQKMYKVHRLVATAFIPNPENKSDIIHLDYDNSNNEVTNLQWATKGEIMRYVAKRKKAKEF